MNEFSVRLGCVFKELKLNPNFVRAHYCNKYKTFVYAKQMKNWISGEEEPPLHFIAYFCKHADISSDYILGLSDCISKPISIDDFLHDLNPSQRLTIKTTLEAFRKNNEVQAKNA